MKKILSLLTVLAILFTLGSCELFGKNDEEEEIPTTSARNIVISKDEASKEISQGKITGATFALGSKIDDVKQYFLNIIGTNIYSPTNANGKTAKTEEAQIVTAIGENDDYYQYNKGTNFSSVWYNGEKYFFLNSNIEAGVSIIVCNETAFGFNIGNCPSVDVVNSLGEPDYKDIPDASQLFFCLGTPNNPTRYTYNFDNKRLDFIFSDDNLLVVTLTDTAVYNGFTACSPVTQTAETTLESTQEAN